MTKKQAKNIRPGDEVYWNDPDDGACSRVLKVQTIELLEDGSVASIMEPDGSVVECYVSELA